MSFGNDIWFPNLKINVNVEKTFAVSYNSSNYTGYLFVKNPSSGTWEMDSVQFPNVALDTTLGEGFKIGAYPMDGTSGFEHFVGTIGLVRVYSHAYTSIENIEDITNDWDYTYCSDMKHAFQSTPNLGNNSEFKMNNCNLVNLVDSDAAPALYQTFYESFGYNDGSYTIYIQELKNWNIAPSNASGGYGINMYRMFYSSNNFNGDVSGWTITDSTNMQSMFQNCENFEGNGLSTWTITPSQNMENTITNFANNTNIDTENYSSILEGWDTTNMAESLSSTGSTSFGDATYNASGWIAKTSLITKLGSNFTWNDGGSVENGGTNYDGSGSGPLKFSISDVNEIQLPILGKINGWPVSNGIVYVKCEAGSNVIIEDFMGVDDKIEGLTSSTTYTVEIRLPEPNLTDTSEDWGISFRNSNIKDNATLDIQEFNGIVLYNGGGEATNTDGYGEQFYEFNGQISATNAPSMRVNTTLRKAFYNSGFGGHSNSNSDLDLSSWDLSNAINFSSMFYTCAQLGNGFNVTMNNWNIRGSINDMFNQCTNFNGDLSGWTITDPTSMHKTFNECNYFRGKGLSTWEIISNNDSQPFRMDKMFYKCLYLGFETDIDLSSSSSNTSGGNWDYTKCNNLNYAFYQCKRLGLGTGAAFRMNGCNLVNLNESSLGALYATFDEAFGHGITGSTTSDHYSVSDINHDVELKNWTISPAIGSINGIGMQVMFQHCWRFNGDVSGWTITDPTSMHKTFNECNYFRGKGLSTWEIISNNDSQPFRMDKMFYKCLYLGFETDIDLSSSSSNTSGGNWDYTKCNNLNYAFYQCKRLGLGTGAAFRMNGCNLVNLNESSLGALYATFDEAFGHGITGSTTSDHYSVSDINHDVELKNWTISPAIGSINGIGMQVMFQNCWRFNGDVSGWTIRSPKTLHKVFNECHYFRGKGLSTWDVDAKQPIGIFNHLNNSDWETSPDGATPTITIDDMKGYGGSNNLGIVSIASTDLATHGAVKQWALDTELNDNTIIITETDYYNSSDGHTIFMKITLDGVKVENSGKKREGWNGPFGTAADLLWYYHDGLTTSVSSLTYTFAPGPNFDNMDFTDTNAFNHYTVNNIAYSVSSSSGYIAPSTYDALDYPSYITQSVKQNVDRISATIDVDTAVKEVFFVILASSSVFEAPSGTWASTSGGADENAEYYGVYVNPEEKWWGFEKVFGSTAVTLPNLLRNLGDEWDRQITVEYENGVITLKLGQQQVSVYTWKPVHTGKWYGVVGAGCDVTFKNVSLESKTSSQPFRMDSMFYKCYKLGD